MLLKVSIGATLTMSDITDDNNRFMQLEILLKQMHFALFYFLY